MKSLNVACPTCRTPVLWSADNPNRPFCSHRCQLIDLGEWAGEGYRLPSPQEHQDLSKWASLNLLVNESPAEGGEP